MRTALALSCLSLAFETSLCAALPSRGLPGTGTAELKPREVSLTLAGFAAVDQTHGIELTWIADFADLTVGYDLERSADGVTWTEVASIPCGVAPDAPLGYRYTDLTPFAGLNHYRLVRHTDAGVRSASAPLQIVHRAAFGLQLWPNPVARGQPLHLTYDAGEEHEFQLELIDVEGRRLKRYSFESDAGANQLTLAAEVDGPGTYFLRVFIDETPVQAFPVFVK